MNKIEGFMESESFCFLVRHGERADSKPEFRSTYEISFDPCLTPTGIKQASTASKFFIPYLEKFEKKNIYIYSSPLLRTMQTASEIIIGLGLKDTHKIRLTSYLIEELCEFHFPVDPILNCLLVKKAHNVIKDQYLKGVDFVDEDKLMPLKFPEAYSETTQRLADGFYLLTEQHKTKKDLVIFVSHGRCLEEFNRYFGEPITDLANYCGISGVKKDSLTGQWKILMTNYSPL